MRADPKATSAQTQQLAQSLVTKAPKLDPKKALAKAESVEVGAAMIHRGFWTIAGAVGVFLVVVLANPGALIVGFGFLVFCLIGLFGIYQVMGGSNKMSCEAVDAGAELGGFVGAVVKLLKASRGAG